MIKGAWIPLLIAACALQQACGLVLVAGGAAAYTTAEDRRSAGTQFDDEAIEVRVSNRIIDRYGEKVHVNAVSYNRSVLLSGEVPDDATRAEIERITLAVPSVRGITNELQVAGASSLGARTNDGYITSKVKARFLDAKAFNALHVKVVTEAGIVYLLGVVTDQEADDAVDLARSTGGVRKVVKIFEYCKPSDEICKPARKTPPPNRAGPRSS